MKQADPSSKAGVGSNKWDTHKETIVTAAGMYPQE